MRPNLPHIAQVARIAEVAQVARIVQVAQVARIAQRRAHRAGRGGCVRRAGRGGCVRRVHRTVRAGREPSSSRTDRATLLRHTVKRGKRPHATRDGAHRDHFRYARRVRRGALTAPRRPERHVPTLPARRGTSESLGPCRSEVRPLRPSSDRPILRTFPCARGAQPAPALIIDISRLGQSRIDGLPTLRVRHRRPAYAVRPALVLPAFFHRGDASGETHRRPAPPPSACKREPNQFLDQTCIDARLDGLGSSPHRHAARQEKHRCGPSLHTRRGGYDRAA